MTKGERIILAKSKRWKPGEICIVSGQYVLTNGQAATVTRGEPFPPASRPRMTWKLSDVTR